MIVFRTHRTQLLALAGGAAAFGLGGLVVGRRFESRIRRGMNLLSSGYFLFHGARLVRLAMRPAALVLGREGIVDEVGGPPAGFLPWEELLPAETVSIQVGLLIRKFVGLRLDCVDPRQGGRRRPTLEPPMFQGYAVLIPEYVLEDPVEEVVSILNQYIEEPEDRADLGTLAHAPRGRKP